MADIAMKDQPRLSNRVINIVGNVYGLLTVIEFSHFAKGSSGAFWRCVCKCGKERVCRGAAIKSGEVQSCGCAAKTGKKDLSGKSFNRWTVLHFDKERKSVRRHWVCRCECGNIKSVATNHLTCGNSKSCGCNRPSGANSPTYKHGRNKDIYGVWSNIIQRCENKNNPQFKDYGGRGIAMCIRWRCDFSNFEADMGERPTKKHTIERVDNDKGYTKENCKWATRSEQARNNRRNLLVDLNGEMVPLVTACEEAGINYAAAKWRHHAGHNWRGIE